jgi:RNA ligase
MTELMESLEWRMAQGLIRRQKNEDGSLLIHNYTEHCQYGGHWDNVTLQARGLVTTPQGHVVARPFQKFFNIGERHCPAIPANDTYEVFEKIDGSCIIAFHYNGKWRMVTRGSFNNVYIDYASRFLDGLEAFPQHWTIIFEVCLPSTLDPMPRVVNHEPGLYLLGGRDLYNGTDLEYDRLAQYWDGRCVQRFNGRSIDDLMREKHDLVGAEGWVVRWFGGLRMKVKGSWYLALFRAVSDLSEKRIKELMVKTGIDDVVAEFPEELRDEAETLAGAIKERFVARRGEVLKVFTEINTPIRKDFALKAVQHPDRDLLFLLYDGASIDEKLIVRC